MKTVAITTFGAHVAWAADHAEEILLATLTNDTVTKRETLDVTDRGSDEVTEMVVDRGVSVLLCGEINDGWSLSLSDRGIHVIPWIQGNTEEVLHDFCLGVLTLHRSEIPWSGTE
jgi:predicted Fe-Mo cluster-binding NifX family protein